MQATVAHRMREILSNRATRTLSFKQTSCTAMKLSKKGRLPIGGKMQH